MRGPAAILTALLLVAGCARREHANPLDPANPETRGRPADFVALAGNSHVSLRWRRVDLPGVVGYQLFRRVASEPDFQPLSDLIPVTHDRYDDFGLANGVEHFYRLHYLFTDGPAGSSAEDAAIPGRLMPYATDLDAHALLTLTPDGRHVATSDAAYSGPTHVAVDPGTGLAWISDTFGGAVVSFDPAIGIPERHTGFDAPSSIAVDPARHEVWVCDESRNSVYHLAADGSFAMPEAIQPLGLPIALALGPDGSVWVCENQAQQVRHVARDGTPIAITPTGRPSRVAVDSSSGAAWVTSFETGQVFQVAPGGGIQRTVPGFGGPIGIAVDPRNDRVWVADAIDGAVVALRRNGTPVFRLAGFPQAREVAVDAATGTAWVTVPGAGQIVAITLGGAVRSRITGLAQPYAIALDPGVPRFPEAAGRRSR